MPRVVADTLWRLLGFPTLPDDAVAFTPADAQALEATKKLMRLGVLNDERQAALVRTWGRSFARLAEWQVALLSDVALERGGDAEGAIDELTTLAGEVLPLVEELQTYIWKRHLHASASRLLAMAEPGAPSSTMAVCFVDIVGYTSRSKELDETELVAWVEQFEDRCAAVVGEHGGRIIKTLGDAVLYVCDDPVAAAEIALTLTGLSSHEGEMFPSVRAGLAYGEVVPRLGDVFGPTVNIASRLTSIARPDSVLVDDGAAEALSGGYSLQRLRRTAVKGYSRLQPWRLRPVERPTSGS